VTYRVTIGGKVVLADAPVSYRRLPGTMPGTMSFRLRALDADELIEAAGVEVPISLRIEYPQAGVDEIRPLYVIAQAPTEAPQVGSIVVADRRWWWGYRQVMRRFNMRRRVGFERVTTVNAQGNYAVEPVSPTFAFRAWSLDGGQPWTVRRMLEVVIGEVDPAAVLVFDPSVDEVPEPALDDVEIHGDGGSAIAQLLAYMPELEITVDADGRIIVYSRAAGLDVDEQTAAALGPTVSGSQHLYVQDLRCVAPAYYDILFPLAVEVRFDSLEPRGQSVVADPDELQRTIRNVIGVPDFEVEVDGNREVQGTWVDFEAYLEALDPPPGLGGVKLDLEFMRVAAVPGVGLWEALGEFGDYAPDVDWQGRIDALVSSYRRDFRLPRGWIDAILEVSANRVATVNQATGQRGESLAFADHAIIAARKSMIRDSSQSGGPGIRFATNVQGWTETITRRTKAAPARVSVRDPDLGIVNVDYRTDPWGLGQVILPGLVEAESIPVQERADGASESLTFNSLTGQATSLPRLAEQYRIAVILTLRPAAPNSIEQYYRVRVTPDQVSDVLHPRALTVAQEARGPGKSVVVRQEDARVRWEDSQADLIERTIIGPPLTDGEREQLGALVVNDSRASGALGASRGASLQTIARAIAARGWASYALHLAGSSTGGAARFGDVPLRGFAQSVETTLASDGSLLTSAAFAERLPEFDWTTLLDAASRAILFRQIPR
jgi:hypothetical protein